MNFINPNITNKNNQDYDIELWWYGFKNLINNYFNNILTYKNLNEFSNKLNNLQSEEKYLDIYTNIYEFVLNFLEEIIVNTYPKYNYELILTWLKRYNDIDYVKKIELPTKYTNKKLSDLHNKDKILLLLNIRYLEPKDSNILIKLFCKNTNEFLDYCIENQINKILNLLTMSYNLQCYFDFLEIKRNYVPMKYNKFVNLILSK
jgi:hypothetical protein